MEHHNPEIGVTKALNWKSYGFEDFNMLVIDTIGDGNCYFHALLNAFYIPYRTQSIGKETVNRRQLVSSLRNDLAKKLGQPINPLNPNGPTFYTQLSRGKMYEFGKEVSEYSFEEMRKRLKSSEAVGNEYNEFISDQLNKDIYILDADKKDVYITGNDDDLLYKDRSSIVLLYSPGHYELIGLRGSQNQIQTYFSPVNPFIQFLRSRMNIIRGKN